MRGRLRRFCLLTAGLAAFAATVSAAPAPLAGGPEFTALARAAPATASLAAAVIGPSAAVGPLPDGFVGFSLEYPAVHEYLGRNPQALNPVFLALIRDLNPDQSPILRIGGDSTDATWWPMPGTIPPAGVTYALSPDWLAVVRAMATRLDARLILGINLAADDPLLAATEARVLVSRIGSQYVDSLEIGNEADVYNMFSWYRSRTGQLEYARGATYTMPAYIAEFSRWSAALPHVPLAGPAFAQGNWMGQLGTLIADAPDLRVVTYHRYPTRACESNRHAPDYASVANLLSNNSSAGLAALIAPYITVAHAAGDPFRLDELNSASCKGKPGVSNTFASALWALDTLFNVAAVGADGVNIHTLPGAAYAPFTFTRRHGRWRGTVRPLYYGLLMFAQAFPAGARLLTVQAPAGPVKVWSTLGLDGHTRVVIIDQSATRAVNVSVTIPGAQTPATVERLAAPGLTATSGVTIGGTSFGASTTTGVLPLHALPAVTPTAAGYTVSVPAASAVLLTR